MKKKQFAYTALILSMGIGIAGCGTSTEQTSNKEHKARVEQSADATSELNETQTAVTKKAEEGQSDNTEEGKDADAKDAAKTSNTNSANEQGKEEAASQAQTTKKTENAKQTKASKMSKVSKSGKVKKAKNKISGSEESYDTVENIFSNMDNSLDDLASHKYENIKSSEKLNIAQPEHVGKAVMKIADNFNSQAENVFQKYAGETYNADYCSAGIDVDGVKKYKLTGSEYNDKANNHLMQIENNGYFWSEYNGVLSEYTNYAEEGNEHFLLTEQYQDKSYRLKDGIMKLSEIIAKADKEAEKWAAYQGNIGLKPYEVYVDTDQKTGISKVGISYCQTYGNAEISISVADKDSEQAYYNSTYSMYVAVDSVKEPVSLMNWYNADMEMQEEYDTIISFDEALKLLDETVADISVSAIKKVGLEYVISSDETEKIVGDLAGAEYEATPYWVIYAGSLSHATVDCKTGEVKYYQNGQLVREHKAVAD